MRYLFIFCLCVLISIPSSTYAEGPTGLVAEASVAEASGYEVIDTFKAVYTIREDGSVNTEEYIAYDFGQNFRHGIFRNIRIKNAMGKPVVITDFFIANEYTKKRSIDFIKYQIGNKDAVVSGKQEYSLGYVLWNTLEPKQNSYELYWNVTGNQTLLPTEYAEAKVFLPRGVSEKDVLFACYVGKVGDTAACESKEFIPSESAVIFRAHNLAPSEGFTIAVSFPKELINYTIKKDYIRDYGPLAIVLLASVNLLYMARFLYRTWKEKGRDPEVGAIVPEYDLPKDFHVYDLQFYVGKNIPGTRLSALIIDLAIRGVLRIKRIGEASVFSRAEYEFVLLKKISVLSGDSVDAICIAKIFGDKERVLLSEIPSMVSTLSQMDTLTRLRAEEAGDYISNSDIIPKSSIWKHLGFAGALIVPLFFLQAGVITNIIAAAIILSTLIGAIVFLVAIPAFTDRGILKVRHILGLTDYLMIAEKDRLAFHNAPEKTPEVFEKLLAAAIALGVDTLWAKEFEGIEVTVPWYQDTTGNTFTAGALVSSMGGIESQMSTIATPKGSASSGGGRSGGGGGGGGTGSW